MTEKELSKEYKNALTRFKTNLSRKINNQINRKVDNFISDVMELARDRVIQYIDTDTQMKNTSGSISAIEELKNRIVVEKTKTQSKTGNDYKLKVKNLKNKDDFALFLEYGTGYRGRLHSGETGMKDWKYVTNPEHDPAFYFKYDDTKFLSNSDNYPAPRPYKAVKSSDKDTHSVSRTLKNGKTITYVRKNREKTPYGKNGFIFESNGYTFYPQKPDYKYVRSIGIRPVRYMYKTSQDIKNILKQSKKLSIQNVLTAWR